MRRLLPLPILEAAETRAQALGIDADRVLVTWGVISEEAYAAALAAWIGMEFEPLLQTPRGQCPLSDEQLLEAANTGMLPLLGDDSLHFVVTPGLAGSRRLIELATSGSGMLPRFRLTSTTHLHHFVSHHARGEIERRAVADLRLCRPELSAGVRMSRRATTAAGAAAIGLAALLFPGAAIITAQVAFSVVFLAWTALRLIGLLSDKAVRRRPKALRESELPIYSIVIALYREAAAVKDLVASLRALHYPQERLDVKLILERDDAATRDEIARLQLGPPFEVILAPPGGPRTKPKALNAALPFVRGDFVVVYDAEDRPDRDQLRLAFDAFAGRDRKLACVQARLSIDNTRDSWLTRMFTAEYAGLFDVFLPGLAAFQFPLPLGGSSNHFRTSVLRSLGAWDPYNVTEDADLGMRLARFGYRTGVIASTTYEEAPARFGPWLRQRTRWFKGWMQTWLVHMRQPKALLRDLGWRGFAVFQLVVGGTVLASLIHAMFVMHFVFQLAMSPLDAEQRLLLGFYATFMLTGYGVSAALGLSGLARRNLLQHAWVLSLMPLYWLLLSWAAWCAVYELLRRPHHWEKTEHGLARTSRRGAVTRNSA